MRFTDEIPTEFKDEEKWLKFFPKRVFITLLVLVGIGVILIKILSAIFKVFWPFLIAWLIFTAVIVLLMMIPTSLDNVMRGGGQDVMSLLIKKFHRKRQSCIYIKGFRRT